MHLRPSSDFLPIHLLVLSLSKWEVFCSNDIWRFISFSSVRFCFMYLKLCTFVELCLLWLWEYPLFLTILLVLKSVLFDIISHFTFLMICICMVYLFHSFTFNLSVLFGWSRDHYCLKVFCLSGQSLPILLARMSSFCCCYCCCWCCLICTHWCFWVSDFVSSKSEM